MTNNWLLVKKKNPSKNLSLYLNQHVCKNCSYMSVYDRVQLWYIIQHRTVLIIFCLTHQKIITVQMLSILLVNWCHICLTDLVSAKGKTNVSWLISFHSLIRQCFNILIWHSNPSRIRNIKIERSNQLYHNNTLPLFSPLPKLRQWMWRQLTERIVENETCNQQSIHKS